MDINRLLFLLLLLFFVCLLFNSVEHLRIQGSWDLRGDPPIIYNPFISPWNAATSFPKRRRRMIIGEYPSDGYY